MNVLTKEFKSYEWKACILKLAEKFPQEDLLTIINKIELKYLEGIVLGLSKDSRTSEFGKIMKMINSSTTLIDIENSHLLLIDKEPILEKLN